MTSKSAIFWGSLHAFTAVAAGAFGAHALKERLAPEMLEVFKTGAHYELIHGVALFAVGALGVAQPNWFSRASALCFCLGSTLFSGSLYVLALTEIKPLGMITPFGGLLFLIGWLALARHASRQKL